MKNVSITYDRWRQVVYWAYDGSSDSASGGFWRFIHCVGYHFFRGYRIRAKIQ